MELVYTYTSYCVPSATLSCLQKEDFGAFCSFRANLYLCSYYLTTFSRPPSSDVGTNGDFSTLPLSDSPNGLLLRSFNEGEDDFQNAKVDGNYINLTTLLEITLQPPNICLSIASLIIFLGG